MKSYSDVYQELFNDFDADFLSIKEFLASLPPGPVAEVGAGTGRLKKLFDEAPREAILIDSDNHMINKLNHICKDQKAIQGYSYQLPLETKSCAGIIFACNSIAEMHPQFFSLSEASRAILDGGKLYITCGNPKGFRTACSGLARSAQAKIKSSISAETIQRIDKGSFEYDVLVIDRLIGSHQKYFIEHVYPPLEWWRKILEGLNFEIENLFDFFSNDDFNEETSLAIRIIAKKKPSISTKAPIEAFYDSLAAKYDHIWPQSEYGVPQWLNDSLRPIKDFHPRMLDLGCGSGVISDLLKDLNLVPSCLFGIDLSDSMIQEARQKNRYTALAKYNLSNGLPDLKSSQYDVITACGLMEFIPNKYPLLSDIFKQLDLGGLLLATFEVQADQMNQIETIATPSGEITRFRITEDELQNTLSRCGFKNIQLTRKSGYRSPTTRRVVEYFFVEAKKTL